MQLVNAPAYRAHIARIITQRHPPSTLSYRDKRRLASSWASDYPNAAANLRHYLDASGDDRVMPVDIFRDDEATKDKLESEHRKKFIEGGKKRLADGRLKPGAGQVEMPWTGSANAFSKWFFRDLGLAAGGYTLCSNVKVSASITSGGKVKMNFDEWLRLLWWELVDRWR